MTMTRKSRQFSLRSLLLWILLVSSSLGVVRTAVKLESEILGFCGLTCLGISVVIALVILQRRWKYTVVVLATLFVVYVATYIGLSVHGRYEPLAWGVHGVKVYAWAPAGFTDDSYRWNSVWTIMFGPLYCIDANYWHTQHEGRSGRYPIHLVR